MKENNKAEVGVIGLGVMGRNLLLNIADHGFSGVGYDRDKEKGDSLKKETQADHKIQVAYTVQDFVKGLKTPRAIIILVPAGKAVDAVINDLTPLVQPGDLIIDAGNSYFKDTDARVEQLQKKNIHFIGVGVSGGEEGARLGPSMMPGGSKEAYERIKPILEAISVHVNGDPCVAYLGTGSAGHFVKMVHNGMEYGLMQLIAETYDLMKRGLGLNNDELSQIYASWNKTELSSYLIEITSNIFKKKDTKSSARLLDKIVDVAEQKGTGMWTSQSSMELFVPTPTIDLAVVMRNLSRLQKGSERGNAILERPLGKFQGDRQSFIEKVRQSLYMAMIITYAQGMALLRVASNEFKFGLDLEAVARIWRGGCIIRAGLLEDIREAYKKNPQLVNLMLDAAFAKKIKTNEKSLREVLCTAIELGIPVPCLMSTLSYLDAYRSSWLPANLIQAQRDYFGAHTYERIDEKGTFHTEWEG